jgi:hypothetical protein
VCRWHGDLLTATRAGPITQAFRPPVCFAQVHTAGFYDDAGFCQGCDAPYCCQHWHVSDTGYDYCLRGHGKSLDLHWSPLAADQQGHRAWLEDHPRIRHAFIPKGACWLNLQEGWWRIVRKTALAGQTFADSLTRSPAPPGSPPPSSTPARPWVWGRPEPKPRSYRRRFIYTL